MAKIQHVFLVGVANSGKTSLFNLLTNSRHKTVNYPGTTVDYALGALSNEYASQETIIVDSPGISSFNAKSLDEEITLKGLTALDKISKHANTLPDKLILVLDATQIEKQLVLLRQFQTLNIPFIVAISKGDLQNNQLNLSVLSQLINLPVVTFSSKTKTGIQELIDIVTNSPIISTFNLPENVSIDDYSAYYEWAENTYKLIRPNVSHSQTIDPDTFFLHPIWGGLLFIGCMALFFWSIFTLASPFIDGVDQCFSWIKDSLSAVLPQSFITNLLINGIIEGLGAVLVFVPQIYILFVGIGMMESSGYLARGAVIVDRPLAAIGLSGKSFVPLLSGCACAIPAMMAARTIPNKKERFVTLFVIPLMTCSARLPVYGLLISLLFIGKASWISGLAMTGIYIGSIVLASITIAIVGKCMNLKKQAINFDIELPSWHKPALKNTLIQAYDQTLSFIKKAGPTILVVSVILWFLTHFPSEDASYITHISYFIEPIWLPMGLNGLVGVALLLSFAAREVFVSALALLFSINEDNTLGLISHMQTVTFEGSSALIFTPSSIAGLIVFFMISMQCISTLAIAKKEMGGWKYPTIMTLTYVLVSYVAAVVVVQGLRLLGIQ